MKTAMRNQKMKENKGSLTVFFEEPFWVGVFELIEDGKLSVCKVTFGAEPKDYAVLEYVLQHYYELRSAEPVQQESRQSRPGSGQNPSRPCSFCGSRTRYSAKRRERKSGLQKQSAAFR